MAAWLKPLSLSKRCPSLTRRRPKPNHSLRRAPTGKAMSETVTTKADKKASKNELRDTIVVIVEALLIALVFRTFLYQPFSIPTASMQSTLMIGDYFVASKYTWGLGKY